MPTCRPASPHFKAKYREPIDEASHTAERAALQCWTHDGGAPGRKIWCAQLSQLEENRVLGRCHCHIPNFVTLWNARWRVIRDAYDAVVMWTFTAPWGDEFIIISR